MGKLEAVPDLGALDWRGTAEAAVRAALAGGAKECDVLVLRRVADDDDVPAAAEAVATEPPESESTAVGGGQVRWVKAGWSDRRGGAWSKRFLGSIGGDGAVLLEEVGGRGRERAGG